MKRSLLIVLALILLLSACGKTKKTLPVGTEAQAIEASAEPKKTQSPQLTYAGLISSCDYSTMAVKSNGELYGWGDDVLVQKGWKAYQDGSVRYAWAEKVVSVSCTRWSFVYIDAKGGLWGVNWPPWGYLEKPTSVMSDKVKLMDRVQLAALDATCILALDEDGVLWTWGIDQKILPVTRGMSPEAEALSAETPKKCMDGVRFATARDGAYYALREDGSLWGWGNVGIADENGSLQRAAPQLILDGVAQVSGGRQSLAVKEDGSLWAWGAPEIIGTNQNSFSYFKGGAPQKIMDEVSYADAAFGQFAAVKTDGTLWVWGSNRNGALGDGTDAYRTEAFHVMDEVEFVSCGNGNIYAVDDSGGLWELGTDQNKVFKLNANGDTEGLKKSRLPHKLMDGIPCKNKAAVPTK